MLKKEDLDDAFKDKKFPENSKVELLFERDTERLHGMLLFVCVTSLTVVEYRIFCRGGGWTQTNVHT